LRLFALSFFHDLKMRLEKVAIINIQFENKAIENLNQIAKKQVPFAVAKTLTNIAQKSQEEVRKNIREKFFIRKKSGGFESSIRIKPATKRNLTAQVYTMATFAALQQTGGTKKAKDGRLAIPAYQAINKVKKRSDSNSPSTYLAGDAFKIKTKSGQEVIAHRKGKELKILFFLRKNARVDKRLDMIETTTKTVKDRFDGQFSSNLSEALNKKVL
jgi:hypothetical protein